MRNNASDFKVIYNNIPLFEYGIDNQKREEHRQLVDILTQNNIKFRKDSVFIGSHIYSKKNSPKNTKYYLNVHNGFLIKKYLYSFYSERQIIAFVACNDETEVIKDNYIIVKIK